MRDWKKTANAAVSWRDHVRRRDVARALPLRVHLELNDYCNLACPLCARRNPAVPKNTGHMSLDVVRALRPAFRAALNVGLAGNGEPFLHPRLFDILDLITAEGAVPSIVTNFTLITAATARRLIGYGPLILMASIDAGTKSVYDAMRTPADFDVARDNLLALRREKEQAGSPFPAVNFLVTLCKLNQFDMPNVVALAKEVGAGCVTVQNCYPYNEEARRQMIDDAAAVERAIGEGREAARRAGLRFQYHPMARGLLERSRLEAGDRRPPASSLYCPNVWTQLHVLVNGDVRVCCFSLRETIGNVTRQPLRDIWNHPLMIQTRREMLAGRIPSDCPACHLLEIWDEIGAARRARAEFVRLLKGR